METAQDREQLSELLERCVTLCGETESELEHLADSKLGFLSSGVADALQQLELILRIVKDEKEDSPQRQARQGLFKRLFQRGSEEETTADKEEFELPTFDVSQMGLHGNTATIPVTELLSFLAYGAKTGVLWVDSPEENFLVGLVDGQLRHANSDHTPPGLRLGEVLVALGFLTQRQLDRHLVRDEETGQYESVTGEALLESGIISDDELGEALAYQTRSLFQRLISTQSAVFRFREGMQVALAYQVALDINQLLLDNARVQDEAAHHRRQEAAAAAAAAEGAEEIEDLLAQAFTETVVILDDEIDEEDDEEQAETAELEEDSEQGSSDDSEDEAEEGEGEKAEAKKGSEDAEDKEEAA